MLTNLHIEQTKIKSQTTSIALNYNTLNTY